MMKLVSKKTAPNYSLLDPESSENLSFFSKRWRYTPGEIKNAILYTGSLDPLVISEYLRRDSFFYHPVKGLKVFFDHTRQLIF